MRIWKCCSWEGVVEGKGLEPAGSSTGEWLEYHLNEEGSVKDLGYV